MTHSGKEANIHGAITPLPLTATATFTLHNESQKHNRSLQNGQEIHTSNRQVWRTPEYKLLHTHSTQLTIFNFTHSGGPGVGKGTQCALAATRLNAQHISTGQLLRNEQQRTDSPYAETITQCFNTSVPAPPQIITALMRSAVSADERRVVLLDGFPRSIEQLDDFKKEVTTGVFFFFFSLSTMQKKTALVS